MVQGFLYSFDNYNLIRPGSRHFVGLDNYFALWRDPTARSAVINTFLFTFGAVTIEFVLGLGSRSCCGATIGSTGSRSGSCSFRRP